MIPEAKITILNEATGVQQVVQSSSEGNFVQPYVLRGLYTVTVEKEGFDKSVTTGVRLNVQQTVALDLALKVGNVATTVEVTADAVQLSTSTSSVATVIQGKAILDFPLNGRNPFALANLVPGVFPRATTLVPPHGSAAAVTHRAKSPLTARPSSFPRITSVLTRPAICRSSTASPSSM